MAVDPFQGFANPVTGEYFRCLSSSETAYTTEWIVQPGGYVPFEHIHPGQDEVFHIREGEMRALVNKQEYVVGAGQTLTIPRGVRHQARNAGILPLVSVVEYVPGLDSYQLFQCFAGLTIDRALNRRGLVNAPRIMYLMRRMRIRALVRPAWLPAQAFHALMMLFLGVGTLAGWNSLRERYTA